MTQDVVNRTQNLTMNKFLEIERKVKRINQTVWSIAMAPAVRYRETCSAGGGTAAMSRALAQLGELIPTRSALVGVYPRTLSGLWDEYQDGVRGRKAAREFTRVERGQKNQSSSVQGGSLHQKAG